MPGRHRLSAFLCALTARTHAGSGVRARSAELPIALQKPGGQEVPFKISGKMEDEDIVA